MGRRHNRDAAPLNSPARTARARPAGSPIEILRRIFWLGDESVLGAVDLKALPRVLRRILGISWESRPRLIIALVANLGATIFTLIIPPLIGNAVDQAHLDSADGNAQALVWAGFLLVATSTARGLLTMLSGYQSELVSQRVGYQLRLAFFEKLQRLGFDYHDRVHSGDLITRGMLDLEGVRVFVETGMQRMVQLFLLVVIGSVMVLRTDPLLGALSLSFVPFVVWRASQTGLYLRLTWTRLQRRMSVLTRAIEENLQGTRVVKAFAGKIFELAKFDAAADDALKLSNDRIFIRTASVMTLTFAFYVAMGLVLWIGGHRVISGAVTIGHLTAILAFMTVLQTPVRQIAMVVNTCSRAVSSGSRLFEVLDVEPTIQDQPGTPDLVVTEGVLRFEAVDFAYAANLPKALTDISFEVGPGKTLGILGPPGSGKSTLAQLVARFYDVTGGRVTVDGQDIRKVTLRSLRRAVGIVQQDVFLFDTSVNENVAYAEPEAAGDRIVEAATTAHIHEYVASLPEAYATFIGERGVSLSGGQRQRLSIARGVMPEPSVLIFDDATSAIDAATEHRLRAALQEATAGKTTIIIAHRLSSLMHADEIIVLNGGRIAERGTHAQLVSGAGHYAELYRLQGDAKSAKSRSHVRFVSEGAAT
jgi:ATP-binding cassette subfamily B multidrug efflux pump